MRSVRMRSAALIVILALSAPAAWGAPVAREAVVQVPWEYDTSEGFNVYRLTRDDLVRTDTMAEVAGFDAARIVDAPPVIDKRDFRRLQSNDYAPDRLFVRFKPGRGDGAKSAAHRFVGGEVLTESPAVPDLALVRLAPGIAVGKAIHQYLDRDEVLYAEPLYDATLSAVPNDPNWGDLWGLRDGPGATYATDAWDELTGSAEIVVAIIDDGVDTQESDLFANRWRNEIEFAGVTGVDDDGNGRIDDTSGWDFGDNDNTILPCGTSDHGTHVAGTIGAVGNNGDRVAGMLWTCKLMPIKVQRADQCGTRSLDGSWPFAITYAAANGARVSNCSFGSSSFSQAQFDIILAVQAAGHLVIAAAGNDNVNIDATPQYPAAYTLGNIIAVAAVDQAGARASFSNYGATSVDLGAPGVGIWSVSIFGDVSEKSGTSMAAPHVAGAAALMLGRAPYLTWDQARLRLLDSVIGTPSMQGLTTTGGRLYVPRALGVWVRPGGPLGGGSYQYAYGGYQLQLALSVMPRWGNLNIRAGSIPQSQVGVVTITKPMTISAVGGVVTIGN